MTTFTVDLSRPEAQQLRDMAGTHPALTCHVTHRAALRIGLRVLAMDAGMLVSEVAKIRTETEERRQARVEARRAEREEGSRG